MNNIINWHKKKYPLLQIEDIYLLLYEQVFANENNYYYHKNKNANIYQDLYEEISNNYVRLNLNTFYNYKLDYNDLDKLVNLTKSSNNINHFYKIIKKMNLPIPKHFSFHHSKIYEQHYHPNYVIIDKKLINGKLKIIQAINFLKKHNNSIISLEGKCGAGKTTLAKQIANILDITIIEIDDFFLPDNLKTKKRLNEIGGNIHYERIYDLLIKIKNNSDISYYKYNCSLKNYQLINKKRKNIILLEGVYSYHPYFNHLVDKLMYLDIDEKTQDIRLSKRNNYQKFIDEWIPLENKYYDAFNIKYISDVII